jgi:hypothetical protein
MQISSLPPHYLNNNDEQNDGRMQFTIMEWRTAATDGVHTLHFPGSRKSQIYSDDMPFKVLYVDVREEVV